MIKALGNYNQGLMEDDNGKLYNNEGVLEYMGGVLKNQKNGKGADYHPDGSVKSIGNWTSGGKNGLFYTFYQYTLKDKDTIKDKNLESIFRTYLKELKRRSFSQPFKLPVRSIVQYIDDKKENISLTFHQNGRMSLLGKFQNDNLANKITLYDKTGFIYYKGEHVNTIPNGDGIRYYENSCDKQYIGSFRNGLPDGNRIRILNKGNGSLLYKGQMRNGQIEGKGKRYNTTNGKLRLEGFFSHGLLHGDKCTVYDRYGKILYEGSMDKNRRHGPGTQQFDLTFMRNYTIKKKYGIWAYAMLWGLSSIVPAGV